MARLDRGRNASVLTAGNFEAPGSTDRGMLQARSVVFPIIHANNWPELNQINRQEMLQPDLVHDQIDR